MYHINVFLLFFCGYDSVGVCVYDGGSGYDSVGVCVYDGGRPAYLYRFSRDTPILALNHDFPISCGGVPILEDAGIFRARRFHFVLFSPVFRNPLRILDLPPVKALRCRYK